MKVLFVCSECVPFASTGGLGDVAAALPEALARRKTPEVVRVLPLYGTIDRAAFGIVPCGIDLHVPLGHSWFHATIWMAERAGVRTFFIHNPAFFDRPGIYGTAGEGYEDNFERFLFFQKAVVRLIDEADLRPDVVHCNDWQSGLIPMFLKYGIDGRRRNGAEKTLFTIHNLAHQGWAPAERFYETQLPVECYTMHTLEYYGEINQLKGGLVASDFINTVSPAYAEEIKTPEFGCGLDGVLRERADVLRGILNGIDYDAWNPATDPALPANYCVDDLSGKAECKRALLAEAGLDPDESAPLLGTISRLVPQKGIDLLIEAADRLVEAGARLVLLGTGDARYERALRELAARRPDRIAAWIEYDADKAHRIEAGADLFPMPSEFEPCGQNQLYSMRYGTLPVVRAVGGLADTVIDADLPGGNGFVFRDYDAEAFLQCVLRAMERLRDKRRRNPLVRRAMKQNFSVERMADEYANLYEEVVAKR